jgi:hypothetical protein
MNKEDYIKLKEFQQISNEMLFEMYCDKVEKKLVNTLEDFIPIFAMYRQFGGKVNSEKIYEHFNKKFEI